MPEIPAYHSHSPIIGQEIPGQARGWRTTNFGYSSTARASTEGYDDDVSQASFISRRLTQAPTNTKGRTASVVYFTSVNLDNQWGTRMTYRRIRLSPEKRGTEEKVVSRKFRHTTHTPLLYRTGDPGSSPGMTDIRPRLFLNGSCKHRPAQRGWCTSGFGYLPTDRVSTD
jgi:hypothetical protein